MGMSLLSYLILHQNNVGILLLFQIPESIDILFTVNGQVWKGSQNPCIQRVSIPNLKARDLWPILKKHRFVIFGHYELLIVYTV